MWPSRADFDADRARYRVMCGKFRREKMIKTLAMIAIFLFSAGTSPLAAQEKVIVGGSGSLIEEMTELAKVYMAKHPSEAIQVLQDGMSNTGGIEGAKLEPWHRPG
jgi:ABC-type phosphate transport system substrate-binding protein